MQFDSDFPIYGIVFLSALLLLEGIYLLVRDMTKSTVRSPNRRLRMLASGDSRESVMLRLKRERATAGETIGFDPVTSFSNLVVQTGIGRAPAEVLIVIGGFVTVAGIAALLLTWSMPIVGAAIVLGLLLPMGVLIILRKLRLRKFSRQLPDAIDIMVRSLKAGHPVPTALGLVARELADPCGTEFGLAVDEMTYGLDLPTALHNVAKRVGLEDLRFLVVAVMIQMQVGGNLAEVLMSLSRVIRERQRMRAKVVALSAEGRFSAIVLSVLPFFLAAAVNVVNPRYYADVWEDPIFLPIIGLGLMLMLFGIIVMYRLVNFKL
ncbi:MAG: type II secretion system F family protein [Rhodospirillaceae bacterium]|nr:type II secretion system F family protein [Rhodospirillaceae bacterium]